MIKLSTKYTALLALVSLLVISSSIKAVDWPVKSKIDLSSGFGDFRPGHFHGGVDIRTGGKEGVPIYAPVGAYLYRAKMSYTGSGKAIYLMGDDSFLYVFFHLSDFAPKIHLPVLNRQLTEYKYAQDIYFPKDSIRVKQGELIGYSGQSGNGAPHLHFEKRTADNRPINPLANGLTLDDKVRPTFSEIHFKLKDTRSLFDDGTRTLAVKAVKGKQSGEYSLVEIPYLNSPFGILANCFDQMRAGGMKQTVYDLSLFIDDELYYQVRLDTLDYEVTDVVNLEYDYLSALDDKKHVRRLFDETGNRFNGSQSMTPDGALFGLNNEAEGLHTAKVVAEDNFGNKSTLNFEFFWGPPEYLCELDSATFHTAKDGTFDFTRSKHWEDYRIDSVVVFKYKGDSWGPVAGEVEMLDNFKMQVKVNTIGVDSYLLRLYCYTSNGGVIRDKIFSGTRKYGKSRVKAEYEIIEDGIAMVITGRVLIASETRVELYYKDSLLGVEFPRPITTRKSVCLIPLLQKYARIDRIAVGMSSDLTMKATEVEVGDIYIVGKVDNQEIGFGEKFRLTLNRNNFYQPRFIELRENLIVKKGLLRMLSEHYQIFPESFVCRDEFDFSMYLRIPGRDKDKGGICWLDIENDKWVWMDDNNFDNDTISAVGAGGGSIAIIRDDDPPMISKMNIVPHRSYSGKDFQVSFNLEDTLSGIPENGVTVKLNGQWLPADYDPETFRVVAKPLESLKAGEHHVAIIVEDKVGNVTEFYAKFKIR